MKISIFILLTLFAFDNVSTCLDPTKPKIMGVHYAYTPTYFVNSEQTPFVASVYLHSIRPLLGCPRIEFANRNYLDDSTINANDGHGDGVGPHAARVFGLSALFTNFCQYSGDTNNDIAVFSRRSPNTHNMPRVCAYSKVISCYTEPTSPNPFRFGPSGRSP